MRRITFNKFDSWVDDQSELLAQYAFFDPAEHFKKEGVQFHQGSLHVESLNVSPVVVIDGDLTVDKAIAYEFGVGLLVVNGNLNCDVFNFPFSTFITGDLNANMVDVNSGNDYCLKVGGNINAKSVIERGHHIDVSGTINSPIIRSTMNLISVNGVHVARCGDGE